MRMFASLGLVFVGILQASAANAITCQEAFQRSEPGINGGEWAIVNGCPDVEPECASGNEQIEIVEVPTCTKKIWDFGINMVGGQSAPEDVTNCQRTVVKKLYREVYSEHYARFVVNHQMGRVEFAARCAWGAGDCPPIKDFSILCPFGKKAPSGIKPPAQISDNILDLVRAMLSQILISQRLVDYFVNKFALLMSTESGASATWGNELNQRTQQTGALMNRVLTEYKSWDAPMANLKSAYGTVKTRQTARTTHIAGLVDGFINALGMQQDAYVKVDLDHDQDLDVVLFDSAAQSVMVYLRINPTTVSRTPSFTQKTNGNTSIQVTDMDGDGHLDLALNDSSGLKVLIGNGRGGFTLLNPNDASAVFTATFRSNLPAQFNVIQATCIQDNFVGSDIAYQDRPGGVANGILIQQPDRKSAKFVLKAFKPGSVYAFQTLRTYNDTSTSTEMATSNSFRHDNSVVRSGDPLHECLMSFGDKLTDAPTIECGNPDWIKFIWDNSPNLPRCK